MNKPFRTFCGLCAIIVIGTVMGAGLKVLIEPVKKEPSGTAVVLGLLAVFICGIIGIMNFIDEETKR